MTRRVERLARRARRCAEAPARRSWALAISAGSRLAARMSGSTAKPLRRSRSRRPIRGASTVSTSARKPAASARADQLGQRVALAQPVQLQPQRTGGGGGDLLQGAAGEDADHEQRTGRARARAVAISPSGWTSGGTRWAPRRAARSAPRRAAARGVDPWTRRPARAAAAAPVERGPVGVDACVRPRCRRRGSPTRRRAGGRGPAPGSPRRTGSTPPPPQIGPRWTPP